MPIDFKRLLTARFLFTFAVQMQAVVLGWRIYDLLKDPLYLGFIGLTEAIPAIAQLELSLHLHLSFEKWT
jgi:hypothetical protein